MEKYAQKLPLELKIEILTNLPYQDVMFFTDPHFWHVYWKKYIEQHPPTNSFNPNPEQAHVLRLIGEGRNVFIHAPAGTGKSAILKHYYNTHSQKNTVGITSTTGISALNIGGVTLHSYLGIGLGKEDVNKLYNKLITSREKLEIWKNMKTLIIDEVSMLDPKLFEKLEILARKIRGSAKPFGGVQLVFTGDLFQLPCVSDSADLIVASQSFRKCIDATVELRCIVRQQDDVFKRVLNKIRRGIVDDHVITTLQKRVCSPSPNLTIKPTKLFCTKKAVAVINDRELDKLAAKGHQFREYNMMFYNTKSLNPTSFEYIKQTFIKNSTTPNKLQLCLGAQVMLTFNQSTQLVNGSRGVVVGFTTDDLPIVEFLCGQICVKPVQFTLHAVVHGTVKQVGYVTQIPLKIAYALTIHSSQGSTLDCVFVDLRDVFEYGQAYTALSRVRTLDGLYLKDFDLGVIQAHPVALSFENENEN